MTAESLSPITVYGSSISYFTGKLEIYLRIKGIPYSFQALTARRHARLVKDKTGSAQMPALQLGDGRWMSDSTPIIQWFESGYPAPAVMPADPLQRFFSLLLEDYADEWLWRPAMHYRWHYDEGARFAGCHLAHELAADVPLPAAVKRWAITRRQRQGYTSGDGIVPDQVPGVEAIYRRMLEQLESIFRSRPFLLGDKPSLADIGFSGPIFRHFGLDPVPAEIMRQQAPAVFEWAARLWNTRLQDRPGELLQGIPADWGPILDEIGGCYLPYLCANVDAVATGQKRFDTEVGGVRYRGARWSKYRVWCLQQLRGHFEALAGDDQDTARALLQQHGCWEPLWRQPELPIDAGICSGLPFHVDAKMIDVYD
ncbi:MAG: glutathione S-transferase family protein [Halieaceae bacterium]|jgi:glutathione S-transferase|nr:glutathione S-transferase family protein [Halieaceae bacterium]